MTELTMRKIVSMLRDKSDVIVREKANNIDVFLLKNVTSAIAHKPHVTFNRLSENNWEAK